MNKAFFTGNVGNARFNTVNGHNGPIPVLNFSIGARKKTKDSQGNYHTLWVDCSLWGRIAETMQQYIVKGVKVAVEGDVDVETYQANDGSIRPKLTCRVSDIELLSSRQDQQQQQGNGAPPAQHQQQAARTAPPPAQQQTQQAAQQNGTLPDMDDDIPF